MSREIEVWADWRELGTPTLMGHLRSTPSRGKEVFSFSYDRAWLDGGHSRQLDPDLRFFGGPQYPSAADRPNFGIFLDSSPDRWGRLLMQRREAAQAREEGRPTYRLQETDYLLGVHDEQRIGALRFKEPGKSDAWQCNEPWMRTPPWASLRELEHASWKIQDVSANDDPHYLEWLNSPRPNLWIGPGNCHWACMEPQSCRRAPHPCHAVGNIASDNMLVWNKTLTNPMPPLDSIPLRPRSRAAGPPGRTAGWGAGLEDAVLAWQHFHVEIGRLPV